MEQEQECVEHRLLNAMRKRGFNILCHTKEEAEEICSLWNAYLGEEEIYYTTDADDFPTVHVD